MTITLTLNSQLEKRLRQEATRYGMSTAGYAQRLLEERLNQSQPNVQAVELLQSWIDESDPTDQKETGDYLIDALDADRLSSRKLFPSQLEGESW